MVAQASACRVPTHRDALREMHNGSSKFRHFRSPEARVQRLLEHYEKQSEAEAVAEDEGLILSPGKTVMSVPQRLGY